MVKSKTLPCNLSTVNDRLRALHSDFRISDTSFPKFGDLARYCEAKGHLKLGREKDSVTVAESKYYEEPPPETEEEKAEKEERRKMREEERERRKEGGEDDEKTW